MGIKTHRQANSQQRIANGLFLMVCVVYQLKMNVPMANGFFKVLMANG
jgi:hypothetical protein